MSEGIGVSEGIESGVRRGRLEGLTKVAYSLLTHNMNVKAAEEVAIVTDSEVSPLIIDSFVAAAEIIGAEEIVVIIPLQKVHNEELTPPVAAAMKAAAVIVAPVSRAITHTAALAEAVKNGARYIGLSSITEDAMLHGAITADAMEMSRIGEGLAKVLRTGQKVKVTSDFGTDVTFALDNSRPVKVSCGIAREPGAKAMAPAGEVNLCPIEESVEGVIVIDHWMQGISLIQDKPIRWEFERGRCVSISGGIEAKALKRLLEEKGDENSYYIGEFSVGINPEARITGNPNREGKRIMGHVHMALGTGISAGGKLRSTLHLDGAMLQPVVYVDGKKVVEGGKILAK